MSRLLGFCQTCDNVLIVETNGHGAVIAYEVIPDGLLPEAERRRLDRSHSDLYSFGACFKCKNEHVGWPLRMKEVGFRGLV